MSEATEVIADFDSTTNQAMIRVGNECRLYRVVEWSESNKIRVGKQWFEYVGLPMGTDFPCWYRAFIKNPETLGQQYSTTLHMLDWSSK